MLRIGGGPNRSRRCTTLIRRWRECAVHRQGAVSRGCAARAKRPRPRSCKGGETLQPLLRERVLLWSSRSLPSVYFNSARCHLRRALTALDGTVIPWARIRLLKHVGKPLRRRGYVTGRCCNRGACSGGGRGGASCRTHSMTCRCSRMRDHRRHAPRDRSVSSRDGRDATVRVERFPPFFRFRAPVTLAGSELTRRMIPPLVRGTRKAVIARVGCARRSAPRGSGGPARKRCFRSRRRQRGGGPRIWSRMLAEIRAYLRCHVPTTCSASARRHAVARRARL